MASAVAALAILDCEKYLLSPLLQARVPLPRIDAFAQNNLGFDAQNLIEPTDASAKATALTALCILMIAGSMVLQQYIHRSSEIISRNTLKIYPLQST